VAQEVVLPIFFTSHKHNHMFYQLFTSNCYLTAFFSKNHMIFRRNARIIYYAIIITKVISDKLHGENALSWNSQLSRFKSGALRLLHWRNDGLKLSVSRKIFI